MQPSDTLVKLQVRIERDFGRRPLWRWLHSIRRTGFEAHAITQSGIQANVVDPRRWDLAYGRFYSPWQRHLTTLFRQTSLCSITIPVHNSEGLIHSPPHPSLKLSQLLD